MMIRGLAWVTGITGVMAGAAKAHAAKAGQPVDYGLGLQLPVTEVASDIQWLHNAVLTPLIIVIVLFVAALLLYVLTKFNENANPTPSRVSHSSALEIAWTLIPVLILVAIAIPSFRLLYKQYEFPQAQVVIKATGHQWRWAYAYPDEEGVEFEANMLDEKELKPGQPRLLATDNDLFVPVNAVVHVLVTAGDVIHNWTVPSFGSKIDAVPGRTTATWFKATTTGIYYGQCSELCGINHAFMPISVRVVEQDLYDRWIAARKAGDDTRIEALVQEAAARDKAKNVAVLTSE